MKQWPKRQTSQTADDRYLGHFYKNDTILWFPWLNMYANHRVVFMHRIFVISTAIPQNIIAGNKILHVCVFK